MSTSYDADTDQLEKDYRQIREKLLELRRKRAMSICPFKIGDILTSKDKRARITDIMPRGQDSYKIIGIFLKKDGMDSKREGQLYSWDKWEKEGK